MSANDSYPNSQLDTRLAAGQLIGQYRVSHLLGEGGMAVVWAGANERTGKRVALKVIRPDFMATPGAEAFLRSEGLVASRVNHPNVVTVFDVIEHEGMACIVMELLHGLPLGTYVFRSGPLSLRETASILLPAMRGVAAAHAQGVIHRDLKPQNVFLCIDPDGRMVTTKVLDFGVSSMMDWARAHAVATMPGLVGTPAYIAPECIEGSKRIDERVDVYGFGLLFFESLTGQVPFPGEDQAEVLRKVLTDALTPMRELRADLPAGIVGIVDKATAKRPDDRFVSLNQMASEFEDVLMHATLRSPSLTPVAGVPGSAMSYTLSGPLALAVPTHIGAEPSGSNRQTIVFGGQPPRRAVEEAAPALVAVEEPGHKPAAASGEPVSPSPPAPAIPHSAFPLTVVRVRRGARALLRIPQDSRVLIAAGIGLVVLIGIVLASASRRVKTAAGIPSEQATAHAGPSASLPPAHVPPAVTPIAPSPPAAPLPPSSEPGLGTDTNSAFQELDGNPGQRETQPVVGKVPRLGRAAPPAQQAAQARFRAGKRPTPRAGALRVGDF